MAVPDLLPYEVANLLRKLCRLGLVTERAAEQSLRDLQLIRLSTVRSGDIAHRIWNLRDNLSTYDSAYVAVAELFDIPLLTFDGRIRRATGPSCVFVDV